jgi:hypothetical protein
MPSVTMPEQQHYCSIALMCAMVTWPGIAGRNNTSEIANPLKVQM